MKLVGNYALEYNVEDGTPNIYIFRRDPQGRKHIDRITDFRPYFYVKQDDKPDNIDRRITDITPGFKSVFGDDLVRLSYTNPKHTYTLREQFKKTYEADVLFPLRYLIDEVDTIESGMLRLLYIDIETSMKYGLANYNDTRTSIFMTTIYDSFTKKYYTYVWHPSYIYNITSTDDKILYKFSNEKSMLQALIGQMVALDSDLIIGWNVYFDMNYLVARCKALGIDYTKLSSLSNKDRCDVFIQEHKDENDVVTDAKCIIKGRTIFDLQYFYRRIVAHQLVSDSLDSVAMTELGEGKTEVITSTDDWWATNLDTFISYNINDVYLTKGINEKVKITDFYDMIYRYVGLVNHNDCRYNSRIVETLLMRKHKRLKLPTKSAFHERTEDERFKGAYVAEPITGLHEKVVCVDTKSLYPNIIRSFNLSPETICETGGGTDIGPLRINFNKKSVLSSIIEDMLEVRARYQREMKKYKPDSKEYDYNFMMATALKFINNSIYGVAALSSFRLYDKRIAETVTYFGREAATYLANCANELGYEVIGQDTDSAFIKIKPDEDLTLAGEKIKNYINSNWERFIKPHNITTHYFSVEFEKACATMLIVAKKRYVSHIVIKDNQVVDILEYRGMEVRRSDSTKKARDIQETVADMLLKKKSSKEAILSYLSTECEYIKSMKYPYKEIAIPTKMGKAQYDSDIYRQRAADWSNQHLGTHFGAGSKFYVLYVKHPQTDVIGFDTDKRLPKDMIVDWEKMLDVNVFMKTKGIFNVLGWENDMDIVRNKALYNQYDLSQWC